MYVRVLINDMVHTKRCQGTNYTGESMFTGSNEELCKIANTGETFPLQDLNRKMKEISSRTQREWYIENAT